MGIERLLSADGYRVLAAKNSEDAARMSRAFSPDLVLTTLKSDEVGPISVANNIRNAWDLSDDVPIVVFAVTTLEEGAEIKVAPNIYLSHPDNFNQLRKLISRLVRSSRRMQ